MTGVLIFNLILSIAALFMVVGHLARTIRGTHEDGITARATTATRSIVLVPAMRH
jgi:hypothetical protein